MQEVKSIQVGGEKLSYLKNAQDFAQVYEKDIIAGKYEGGFTLWECTVDLMNYMKNIDWTGKTVLEIGCGHGLVGILALKKGAKSVCFADFNKDVLEKLATKNILNNLGQEGLDKSTFLYGDWMDMQPFGKPSPTDFDIILGSQLIYTNENYGKIVHVINKYLKEDGRAILANKLYYFGVGGSVPEFTEFVEKEGLRQEVVEEINPESGNRKVIVEVKK